MTPGSYTPQFSATDKDTGTGSKTLAPLAITKRPSQLAYTGTTNVCGSTGSDQHQSHDSTLTGGQPGTGSSGSGSDDNHSSGEDHSTGCSSGDGQGHSKDHSLVQNSSLNGGSGSDTNCNNSDHSHDSTLTDGNPSTGSSDHNSNNDDHSTCTTGSTVTLSAKFTDLVDVPTAKLAGHVITFAINGQAYTATTDATGLATVAGSPSISIGTMTVSFAGDALYLPSSATATIAGTSGGDHSPPPPPPPTWIPGGFFAVGPGATLGSQVTFWSSQWPVKNGGGPSAFKGWVTTPTVPSCGQRWSSSPGNSGKSPLSLPALIPVVVTSAVTKTGNVIQGGTTHIVLVKVTSYGPAPGKSGGGQVVATIC
jgi:hypothetical protein